MRGGRGRPTKRHKGDEATEKEKRVDGSASEGRGQWTDEMIEGHEGSER